MTCQATALLECVLVPGNKDLQRARVQGIPENGEGVSVYIYNGYVVASIGLRRGKDT